MIIVMQSGATAAEIEHVTQKVRAFGLKPHLIQGEERTVIGLVGDERPVQEAAFERLQGVEQVMRVLRPFKLASREGKPSDTTVPINGVSIGGKRVIVMAGPCAVESREQMETVAQAIKAAGVKILRGGAFKPRTSPYSFQGLGEEGLEILAEMKERFELAIVTEVMSPNDVELVADHADILQIGARNMQNFALLHAVGEAQKPVLLKRGMMATVEELLMAAEYVLSHGNERVILCERGIRTFEKYTRNTLDLSAVPVLKQLSHLPVVVDPSHGTGKWRLVAPMAQAAVAAGADGLIVEVHPNPEAALSDGPQSLRPDRFAAMMDGLRAVATAVGRTV